MSARTAESTVTSARRHGFIPTPSLGELLAVAEDDAIVGLYFPRHWYPIPEDQRGRRAEVAADPTLARLADELGEYLAGERTHFTVAIRTDGDPMSEQVWAMLREIPYGQTTTYGALAERLGDRNLAQRVGQCVGHNPISIVIPCHRVVGADGSLTGFAGGLERKRTLLEVEEPEQAREARLF